MASSRRASRAWCRSTFSARAATCTRSCAIPYQAERRPPSRRQQDGARQHPRAPRAAFRRRGERSNRGSSGTPTRCISDAVPQAKPTAAAPRGADTVRDAKACVRQRHAGAPRATRDDGTAGRRQPGRTRHRMAEPPLRVLIVDDEAPARRRLRELLDDCAGTLPLAIVGEAANGREALDVLHTVDRRPGADRHPHARHGRHRACAPSAQAAAAAGRRSSPPPTTSMRCRRSTSTRSTT